MSSPARLRTGMWWRWRAAGHRYGSACRAAKRSMCLLIVLAAGIGRAWFKGVTSATTPLVQVVLTRMDGVLGSERTGVGRPEPRAACWRRVRWNELSP